MKSAGEPHAARGLDSIVLDLPIIVDDHNLRRRDPPRPLLGIYNYTLLGLIVGEAISLVR